MENKKKMPSLFKRDHLNTCYLKEFRSEAEGIYQVWKRDNGFFLAIDVCVVAGYGNYAKETKPFGQDHKAAKMECNRLRREYILEKVKRRKNVRKVY